MPNVKPNVNRYASLCVMLIAPSMLASCSEPPSARLDRTATTPLDLGTAQSWAAADLGGGAPAFAFDVDPSGRIVGSFTIADGSARAAMWTPSGESPLDLGVPDGTNWSRAFAINARGQIVGQAQDRTISPVQTFAAYWPSAGDTPVLLTDGTIATAINGVGGIAGNLLTPGGEIHAAFWSDAGGLPVDLGTLGGNSSSAAGMNDAAQIVGASRDVSNVLRAAFWASPGAVAVALAQPTEALRATATGINMRGEIVGDYLVTSTARRALYWRDSGAAPIELAGLGGDESQAVVIDARGRIAGWAETESGERHACLWPNAADLPVDLGTLGGATSFARAINPRGQVVGDAQDSGAATRATAWTPNP